MQPNYVTGADEYRSMQLHYISVTTFSQTDLFLDPISQEWHRLGSAITYHKKRIDVAA